MLFPSLRRTTASLALGTLLAASGCCGPALVSQRFNEPGCGAEVCEVEPEHFNAEQDYAFDRPGVPVMVWPNVTLPRCLTRTHWREQSAELRHEVNAMLQPEPPAPLKPPHSRFHPLPTQPVFAQRAEYKQPELLGVPAAAPPATSPGLEEIAIPVPEPSTGEPTWHDLPAPRPLDPVPEAAPAPAPRPTETQPPLRQPPTDDASRGAIAPASYSWHEPNPLRSARTPALLAPANVAR